METDDRKLLDQWMSNWSDIVDFEVFPVMTSQEAVGKITPYLDQQEHNSIVSKTGEK
jgi:hypothetical protein